MNARPVLWPSYDAYFILRERFIVVRPRSRVGTFKTGVRSDPAEFFHAVVHEPDGPRTWIKSLSGVPEAIKANKQLPDRAGVSQR